MSKDDRDTLASMERQLADLNDKIKNAEKDRMTDYMNHMLAMRDDYTRRINKLRDKLGY